MIDFKCFRTTSFRVGFEYEGLDPYNKKRWTIAFRFPFFTISICRKDLSMPDFDIEKFNQLCEKILKGKP